MPYKDPDPSDPNILVGVVLPAESDTMQEMAYALAEEFAQLGYDSEGLLRVFRNPFYAGAHQAYRTLGEQAIRRIVGECLGAWNGIRFVFEDGAETIKTETKDSTALAHASRFQGRER